MRPGTRIESCSDELAVPANVAPAAAFDLIEAAVRKHLGQRAA